MAAAYQEISLRQPDERAEPVRRTNASVHRAASASEDRQLAEACRKGDLVAYEKLYHLHGARLKSIARNLLGNPGDAEDAVQEVFLKVYRGIGSFKGQSSFPTWIYRILLNCCYDVRRRKVRRQEAPEEEMEPDATSTLEASHPLRLALESCLARLTSRQREVFVLFEVEGFKHSEIAALLSISEAASKTTLYEAKRQLRRLLQE